MTRRSTVTLDFEKERKGWSKGFKRIAGIDEAGRGPLAGPVEDVGVQEVVLGRDADRNVAIDESPGLDPGRITGGVDANDGARAEESCGSEETDPDGRAGDHA